MIGCASACARLRSGRGPTAGESTSDRAAAHKLLAFIFCTSNRMTDCEVQFRAARAADAGFALSKSEAGHPLWGLHPGARADLLVVDAGGDLHNAVVGGILTFYAARIGLSGVVIDGALRDVAEIRARDFPVYARGVTHRGPYKDGPGEINVPVSVGGMVVQPGDIVVGDQDGLLAIPADADVRDLIEKARAVLVAEAATMLAMQEGRWDRTFIDALEARCNN